MTICTKPFTMCIFEAYPSTKNVVKNCYFDKHHPFFVCKSHTMFTHIQLLCLRILENISIVNHNDAPDIYIHYAWHSRIHFLFVLFRTLPLPHTPQYPKCADMHAVRCLIIQQLPAPGVYCK